MTAFAIREFFGDSIAGAAPVRDEFLEQQPAMSRVENPEPGLAGRSRIIDHRQLAHRGKLTPAPRAVGRAHCELWYRGIRVRGRCGKAAGHVA